MKAIDANTEVANAGPAASINTIIFPLNRIFKIIYNILGLIGGVHSA